MKLFFLILIGIISVEATYYGGGDECDCECEDEETTSDPTTTEALTTLFPTSLAPTTMRFTYSCLEGWNKFQRTPSPYNKELGVWCVKFVPSDTAISINNGSQLCKNLESELTVFENEEEREIIVAEAQSHIVDNLKWPAGAIALAGTRIKECETDNKTILGSPPCDDLTKVFVLNETSGTNPEFLWSEWAPNEPSTNKWIYFYESCLQLYINPANRTGTHGRINDFYCVYDNAPNSPTDTSYWNLGALCGRAPEIESVA